ncbi:hypothetical protein [Algoriphagus resistens]|uniref:hypothetical protein n=1 Tax=Algoriphagus resistens TaxID=1750590 RepID=UPI00071688E1|nr:hypothetical protein [Algoriphagus resistens]
MDQRCANSPFGKSEFTKLLKIYEWGDFIYTFFLEDLYRFETIRRLELALLLLQAIRIFVGLAEKYSNTIKPSPDGIYGLWFKFADYWL